MKTKGWIDEETKRNFKFGKKIPLFRSLISVNETLYLECVQGDKLCKDWIYIKHQQFDDLSFAR